jgi:hypothetical protein
MSVLANTANLVTEIFTSPTKPSVLTFETSEQVVVVAGSGGIAAGQDTIIARPYQQPGAASRETDYPQPLPPSELPPPPPPAAGSVEWTRNR